MKHTFEQRVWDPIALHDDMKKAGLLHRKDAAE